MKYLKLFKDSLEVINTLTDEQSGQLFKAIIDYSEDKEPNIDGLLSAVFFQFKQQIDRAKTDYIEVCERNKANGLKPKRLGATGSDSKPSEAKTRQDKDKDKEKDSLKQKIQNKLAEYLNVNKEAFNEWIDYKSYKAIAPITKVLNMMCKYSIQQQQQMVDTSIMNNYQGLFEPKADTVNIPKQIDMQPRANW